MQLLSVAGASSDLNQVKALESSSVKKAFCVGSVRMRGK